MDNNSESPKRKQIRLPHYDYNSNGAYFITICTKDRKNLLSEVFVGTTIGRPPEIVLTKIGRIVEESILKIDEQYPTVKVDAYVIMPNHIHFILFLYNDDGRAMLVPTISRIVQQMKGYATKQIGKKIWQPRFYDHVIRSERDYIDIMQYIENNPAHWVYDKYYCADEIIL